MTYQNRDWRAGSPEGTDRVKDLRRRVRTERRNSNRYRRAAGRDIRTGRRRGR